MKRQLAVARAVTLALVLALALVCGGVSVLLAISGCTREMGNDGHATCLADDLPALHPEWQELKDCSATDGGCTAECLAGDGDACLNLAFAFQAKSDAGNATSAFERACRLGLSAGCTNWAANVWGRDRRATDACTYRVFEKACGVGDVWGCTMISRHQLERPRTPFEPALGSARLIRDCAAVQGPPCRMLAVYLENGFIGDPTNAFSRSLLKKACDAGDEQACGDHATATELLIH